MAITDFRRRARSIVQHSKKQKNTSKNNFWLRWRPPKMDPSKHTGPVAEPIVFLDAEYVDPYESILEGEEVKQPFFHFKEHMFKLGPKDFRSLTCSAGVDPHSAQPCVGCHQVDNGAKSPARDQLAFNIAHLVPYHRIPYVKNGSIVKRENGEPVMITVQCDGAGCENCATNAETKFGEHKFMQVGTGHLNNILSWDSKVSNFCANCSTGVKILGYACSGCTGHLFDAGSSGMKEEELVEFSKSPVKCPHCGETNMPLEILDCGYDPMGNKLAGRGCEQPGMTKRLSLFDVVLYLQREGEGKDSRMVDVSWIPKDSFPTPDGRPLDEHLKEIVPEPFNFEEMFQPLSLDEQAGLLGVANPYSNSKKFANYNRPTY